MREARQPQQSKSKKAASTTTATGQRWSSPFEAAVARIVARQSEPTRDFFRKVPRQRKSPMRAKRSIAASLRRAADIRETLDAVRVPVAPFGVATASRFPLPMLALWLYKATLASERRTQSAVRTRNSASTRYEEPALDVVAFVPTKGRRKCANRIVRARAMRRHELAEIGYHLRQHGVNTRAAWIADATFKFNFDDESYVVRFTGGDRKPVAVSATVVNECWTAALESLAMHVASARRATAAR